MLLSNGKQSEVKIVVVSDDDNVCKFSDTELKNRLNVPHHDSIPSIQNFLNKQVRNERSRSLDPTNNLDGFDPNKRRISSISSLGNWTGPVIVSEIIEESAKKNGKWQKVVDFLDLTLFKDLIYVNIALGISFALYSDTAFFTLQPMYLFELGFTQVSQLI